MTDDSSNPSTEASTVDLHRILIEIDEEVRAKRSSGELSAEFERELDLAFARLAPPGAVGGDFDQLLERAEAQAYFDLIAPNESVRPGVPHVKRVVQKTIRWYLRYVVEQVTSFAQTMTKLIRQLNDRVTVVEQLAAPEDELLALQSRTDSPTPWNGRIVELMRGVEGRVLHARCGTGHLVKALQTAGVDAFGVDVAAELIAIGTAGASGLDLRPDDEREHLRSLPASALGGLVLTGSVDTLPRGAQVELVDLAALVLQQGGKLALIVSNPQVWDRTRTRIEADLAPGRPMHVETWTHLLEERGFTIESVDEQSSDRSLSYVSQDVVMKENIDLLNQVLFPSPSSLLIARR